MLRNRALTEQRLIKAVGDIMTEDGIEGVRINRIASRAGVNKILIYRYFGSLAGLREAYINQTRPIITLPILDIDALKQAPIHVIFDTLCDYVIDEYRLLRQNPQAQAMLRADLLSEDKTLNLLASEKAHHYQRMVDALAPMLGTQYGRPFAALINTGMTLLTLLAQQKRTVFGFDLSTDTAWDAVETTLRQLFRGAYLYTMERLEQDTRLAEHTSPAPRVEEP